MVFGEATERDSLSKPDPIDGVFGMGWIDLLNKNMSVVFRQMIDQGVVDTPVFGFYLNRYYAVYTSLVLALLHSNTAQ